MTLDSGISRLKWQFFDPNDKRGVQIKGMPFLFQFSPYEGNAQVHDAYARRLKCERYFPLAVPKEQCVPLLEKLGIAGKKLALIHIKNYVMNSAAALTNPNTYLPSMGMLKDLGYKLVFVGREKMPEQFRQFDILNYAESFFASLKHDVLLFQSCELAMVTSGISNLAECYDKAFLYINSWHVGLCPFSKWSIFLPALVKKKTGKWLKFSAQNDLYHEVTTMHERFPYDCYIPRNANGDEILHAAEELLSLMKEYKPRSFLQERYMGIDKGRGVLANSLTRVGQYFLEEHQDLLD
ncbi:MAG TPA: TIGR04372 family glycosyltransferase [Chlamydiales bacterium]|nr:TIGR04372 family glycosyltransferase [Chlamydiales bacterium]